MHVSGPTFRPLAMLAQALCAALLLVASLPAGALAEDSQAVLHTRKGNFTFHIEVVDTEAGRERGLMYRKSLAPDAGMLFDFLSPQSVQFWMENTYIPLDMVFIARNGTVTSIAADAKPMDTTPIPSGGPVQFVLEIPGGRAAEIGLATGDHMDEARVKPDK